MALFQPVHESMRTGRVGELAHDAAERIDSKYLCNAGALHFKTEIVPVLGAKKAARIYGRADRAGLIATVHTNDIAFSVDVPGQREEVVRDRECGDDPIFIGYVAHSRGKIKPHNLASRRDAVVHRVGI